MKPLIAALCASGLWLGVGSVQAADPAPASIAVSGHGEVNTLPDRARLSLAVDALDANVKTAESQVNIVVRRYLDALKKLGIDSQHISTTSVSIQPEYVWDDKTRKQNLVGYRARRDIQLHIHDLDQLAGILLSATEAGVNHIDPPQLESSQASQLALQALARAAQDAQAKAQTLATALGVKLGSARAVSESGRNTTPVLYKSAMVAAAPMMDSANESAAINFGEMRIAADVNVTFDLKP
ncbi:SIMPL domain-containing protein [Sinimarinibacterium sp. NLF-5-8]|uniref:SIMPL domain-containing protein n=1 Tax=Sinimarinibacterium sp. NLF-5-8 TaxID=2698684 RepID=UPI00137BDC60|nr:SIMPL domain-containing protein [Sinimarinibacterium sp. NLF-5-8]QHS10703.1 DUF541 domain-containing protein [Sinimarinibacterium sp. NLF-5-8]